MKSVSFSVPFGLPLVAFAAFALPAILARADESQSSLDATFSTIWKDNLWDHPESRSGPGSTVQATTHVRQGIETVLRQHGIGSVLDVACGDFGWMSSVDMGGASYTGLDIVPGLIEQVSARYGREDGSRRFLLGNMTTDHLPQADLVIARDVLGHLSFAHGLQALDNIRASGAKWLLTTTFPARANTVDIVDGGWRAVNLSAWPYNLGAPQALVVERCIEQGGLYADKALGLWAL